MNYKNKTFTTADTNVYSTNVFTFGKDELGYSMSHYANHNISVSGLDSGTWKAELQPDGSDTFFTSETLLAETDAVALETFVAKQIKVTIVSPGGSAAPIVNVQSTVRSN
jgi:hypothetical protein